MPDQEFQELNQSSAQPEMSVELTPEQFEEQAQEDAELEAFDTFVRGAIDATKEHIHAALGNDKLETFVKFVTQQFLHELTGKTMESILPCLYVVTPMPPPVTCPHFQENFDKLKPFKKAAHELMSQFELAHFQMPPYTAEEEGRFAFLDKIGNLFSKGWGVPLTVFVVAQSLVGGLPEPLDPDFDSGSNENAEGQPEQPPQDEPQADPQNSGEKLLSLPRLRMAFSITGLTLDGRHFVATAPFANKPQDKEGLLFEEVRYFFSHRELNTTDNAPQVLGNLELDAFYYGYFESVALWHQRPYAINTLNALLNLSQDSAQAAGQKSNPIPEENAENS